MAQDENSRTHEDQHPVARIGEVSPAEQVDAEQWLRREAATLESEINNLAIPADERRQLLNELARNVATVSRAIPTSGMSGTMGAFNSIRAQTEAGIGLGTAASVARAAATQEILYSSYEQLSLESRVLVQRQLDALYHGSAADFYFSQPDNEFLRGLSAPAKQEVAATINRDPAVTALGEGNKGMPEDATREAASEIELNRVALYRAWRDEKNPEIREQLTTARSLFLYQDKEFMQQLTPALQSGDPAAVKKITDQAVARFAEGLAPRLQNQGILNQYIRKNYPELLSEDHYTIDPLKITQLYLTRSADIKAALNTDEASRTPEQQMLAAVGITMQTALAEQQQSAVLSRSIRLVMKSPELTQQLCDSNISPTERVSALAMALREHDPKNERGIDYEKQAQLLVTLIDGNPQFRTALLGKNKIEINTLLRAGLSQDQGQDVLKGMLNIQGFNEAEVSQLIKKAQGSKEVNEFLWNAVVYRTYPLSDTQLQTITRNILNNGGPENKEAVSLISYYNLAEGYDGSMLQTEIYRGTVDPKAALARAETLKAQALERMEPFAGLVPGTLSEKYQQVMRDAGMYRADGTLDVEKLIDTARRNRDLLGNLSDAQMKEIATKPEDQLTPEELERRVLARAAGRFKAVDLVKQFGQRIEEAYAGIGQSSGGADLQRDLALYNQIINVDGSVDPATQRTAIDTFLKNQQYFRENQSLRQELTDYIVTISQRDPMALRTNYRADEPAVELVPAPAAPAPVSPVHPEVPVAELSREERRALATEGSYNLGDRTFENKMEDRLKDELKKYNMSEIVAKLGAVLEGYNVGRQDNITEHEVENMFAAYGITDPSQIAPGSSRPTLEQIANKLAEAKATAAVPAGQDPVSPAAGGAPAKTAGGPPIR